MKGLHLHANLCSDLLYMSIKKAVSFCLIIGIGVSARTQPSTDHLQPISLANIKYEIQPLNIGDKVPDITFHNVLNYKTKTAKLSDFQGKLVILDMWSVNCTSCIAGFPKMEKLQKEFGDKLQILLVNPHDAKYDSKERIVTTLNKFKTRTGFYPSLPVPIHDSVLNCYFPHESVPHIVWIDGDKNVIAITGSNDVTAENIRKFVAGETLSIAVKNDWAFDNSKPFLFDGNGGDANDFVFRSLFTKYKSGIGNSNGVRLNKDNHVIGIYFLNQILRQLITEAFSNILGDFKINRVFIESDNPEKFKWEFDSVNAYCYDLTIAPTEWKSLDLKRFIQEDLKRFFNVSVRREKRKMTCIIIQETQKLSKSWSKYSEKQLDLDESSIYKYIRKYPAKNVIEFLDRFERPMINATDIAKNIDIEFLPNANLSDIKVVLQVLRAAGFEIQEKERVIEVVIISDKAK